MLFVEKFGGSSLAGVERVRCAARLIADTVRAGHSVAAVLSAQGKTTDALLSTAAHYSRSPRSASSTCCSPPASRQASRSWR